MVQKNGRIFYIDEIRALAILLVILIHVSKWFVAVEVPHTLFWHFSSFLFSLGRMGVPLFFMISGALLLNKEYEIVYFFKRRFSRIFVPFAFWIVIIILYKILFFNHGYGLGNLIDIIFNEGMVWFIWVLVGLYLFIPVISPFINKYKTKGAEYFLIIWITTFIFNAFHFTPYTLDLNYFSGYFGYLILGWYLSNKEYKLSDKSVLVLSGVIFLISTLVSLYALEYQIDMGKYYLTPVAIFQCVGIYLFFMYFAKVSDSIEISLISSVYNFIKDSFIGKIIVSISFCSYGMFLTHYFVIWSFQLLDKSMNIFLRNPFKWIPFIFLITVLFSWILIWIFSKIPLLKKVSGV